MVVGTRAQVMSGTADKTAGHLQAGDLKRVDGRIVSKAKSKQGQSPALKKWRAAVTKAKKKLGIKKTDGFEAHIPKKGTALYKEAQKFYKP